MTTAQFQDVLGQARSLAERTGLPEARILAISAETIRRHRDAATREQIRFHLGVELWKIEQRLRELGA